VASVVGNRDRQDLGVAPRRVLGRIGAFRVHKPPGFRK
jgi:hypothetical protein